MEPKKLYTVRWVQDYNLQQVTLEELEALMDQLIEAMLDEGDFEEADAVIERIKKL
jgi:hypothetical protein